MGVMQRSSSSAVVASNQDHKRAQIIEAARIVLARDGLAGCTARAVAEAGPLTKSAIHYYFDDIDEIIDLAVAAHLQAMLTSLRELAQQYTDPGLRMRAVLMAYLETFAVKPDAAFLWFEYWIAVGRRHHMDAVDGMLAAVEGLLVELLTELPVAQPDPAAHTLLSWLLGSVVQQHIRPRPASMLQAEIDALLCPAAPS
jgi:DNA-binding transcriptional regulator YbjK